MPISCKTFYMRPLTHPFSIPYFQGDQGDPLLKYNTPMSPINHSSLGCCILNWLSLPPPSCIPFPAWPQPTSWPQCSAPWSAFNFCVRFPLLVTSSSFCFSLSSFSSQSGSYLPAWLVLQENTFAVHSCPSPLRFLPSGLPWYSQASWFLLLISSALLSGEFPAPAPWNRNAVRVLSLGTDPWEPPRSNWSWPNPATKWWFPQLWGISFQILITRFNWMESPHCQP